MFDILAETTSKLPLLETTPKLVLETRFVTRTLFLAGSFWTFKNKAWMWMRRLCKLELVNT
jgi:hypothetical protein